VNIYYSYLARHVILALEWVTFLLTSQLNLNALKTLRS